MAALNGVCGDHLAATGNPLAIQMAWRSEGRPLCGAPAAATGRVLVLVHGLAMNDLQWTRNGHDHGRALARDGGFINNSDHEATLLVGGEAPKPGSRIFYPVNPSRRQDMSAEHWWSDVPARELGPHDGLPNARRQHPPSTDPEHPASHPREDVRAWGKCMADFGSYPRCHP